MQNQQPFQRPEHQRFGHDDASDMTPMVDVVFLLLIFFVVTASFQMQNSLTLDSQPTDAPSPVVMQSQEHDALQVNVYADGTFALLAGDIHCETPSKQFLVAKLKEAIGAIDGESKLIVKVDEDAVLQALVNAMDAGSIAGVDKMQVSQVQEFP